MARDALTIQVVRASRRMAMLSHRNLLRSLFSWMVAQSPKPGGVNFMQACFESEDHREGVASFLERRPANFTGR